MSYNETVKTAIIYKSFTGATKKCAKWVQEEVCGDLYTYRQFKKEQFNDYERFLIMSGTYFGNMPLVKYLERNWEYLRNKNVIAIAVGMAPENDPFSIRAYESIPERIREKIHYYKLSRNKLFEVEEIKESENFKKAKKDLKS